MKHGHQSPGSLCAILAVWLGVSASAVAQSQHNPGKNCGSCHPAFKIGGTVFSDSSAARGASRISLDLLAEDGSGIPLGATDSSGNIASTTSPEGRFLVRLGSIASRTWHTLPQQGLCNSCHIAGGNASESRNTRLPQLHTRIPADNECRHCHYFPASMAYGRLAAAGVLAVDSPPPPIPVSQVEIDGKVFRFDPAMARITTTRPDIFAPGYFSMFDVILAVARSNNLAMEYAFDPARQTHFITRINGVPGDYWYHFSYDAGSGNSSEIQYRRSNRWDELLWRPGVWIKVVTGEDLNGIKQEYLEEIEREKLSGHNIPLVRLTINASQYRGNPPGSGRLSGVNREFRNLAVTAHNSRTAGSRSIYPKPFQPGVVTAMDALYSLQDQGLLEQVATVYYSYFASHYIESQYVVGIGIPGMGLAHSSGRQGFIYVTENGAPGRLPNQADGKLHVTSDILVIHAPDFATWQWAELGNSYYEANEPPVSGVGTLMYLPRAVNSAVEQTGLALVNTAAAPAAVSLKAYGAGGVPVAVASPAVNPAILLVPPQNQIARMLQEMFGAGFNPLGGWLEISSDQAGTAGFFLNMDPRLNAMDGANMNDQLPSRLVFPEMQDAEFSLVNPGSAQAAQVVLRLIDNQGQELAGAVARVIEARGSLTFRARDLFFAVPSNGAAYLYAVSSLGLSALETFGVPGVHTSMLQALDGGGGYRELYAPQFVMGGGYRSAAVLVNLESKPTVVALSWLDDRGQAIGRAASVDMPARGRAEIADPALFGVTVPPAGLEGHLVISSSASNISGSVRFGDPGAVRFQTALPLISAGRTDRLYAQAAQNETYFTGVAVVNPNGSPVQVTFAVFNSDGTPAGSDVRTIPPRGRISRLLPELVSTLPAMNSGYFRVRSNLPVISFAVFGTHTLSALSAIP